MNRLLILFFLFSICSCTTPVETEVEAEISSHAKAPKPDRTLNNQEVPFSALAIDENPFSLTDVEEDLAGNSFGKFFGKEAEFFIIENPKNRVFNSKVSSIRLYYLDDKLSQTKYFLESDISNTLINRYGRFGITGFDFDNRDEIENGNIVQQVNGKWKLRDEFTNYRLSWKIDDKEILFRVNKNNPENPYVYIERVSDYKEIFRRIEYSH